MENAEFLIARKQFEEQLEAIINTCSLPMFCKTDIMEKATEKMKHIVAMQTVEAIQIMQKQSEGKTDEENIPENPLE